MPLGHGGFVVRLPENHAGLSAAALYRLRHPGPGSAQAGAVTGGSPFIEWTSRRWGCHRFGADVAEVSPPVNNNDVLRRLRYTFDLGDQEVIDLFGSGGLVVTRELISNLLKKDDDPNHAPCSNVQLAAFLNGLIVKKRGPKEGEQGPPVSETELTNNTKLRKLKIALNLDDTAMLEIMDLAGMPLSRAELSALFRKPGHKHFRECQDQLLRNFLRGLQMKFRDGVRRKNPRTRKRRAKRSRRAIRSYSRVLLGRQSF